MRRLIILLFTLFFFIGLKNIYPKEKMLIEIIPLGPIDNQVLDYLKDNLAEVFSASVSIGRTQPIPESTLDKKRNQYHSTAILKNLLRFKKEKGQKLLAIIDQDLYIQQLNFVFGEADPVNGVCIISLKRLDQTYYGLSQDQDLFFRRSLKEAVHELGHLLNLGHCPNPKCVMHFSNSLLDTDKKDYRFCQHCQKLLP